MGGEASYLVFEWGKSIDFVKPPKFISRSLQKFHLNTTRPTARFKTVPGYVDSDDLVWRRRWFDSTSAAARTFSAGQCVVMVRDTSSLNPETATIHCLLTLRIHLQCRGQR